MNKLNLKSVVIFFTIILISNIQAKFANLVLNARAYVNQERKKLDLNNELLDYGSEEYSLLKMPLHGDMQGVYAEYLLSRMNDDDIEEIVRYANIYFFQSCNRKDLYRHLNEKQRQALLDRFNEYRDDKVKAYGDTPLAQAKIDQLDENIDLIRSDMAITDQDTKKGVAEELHEKQINSLLSSIEKCQIEKK